MLKTTAPFIRVTQFGSGLGDIHISHFSHIHPDLNPIEHVWSAMNKYNIPSAGRHPTQDYVLTRALEAWEWLRGPKGLDLTSKLVASMPCRLNAVIEAGGGYTKF
ncbi:Transposable element Tc1 transposase-like 12 [Homarus americanus]|uniref:Transposable element Tc1 transposase-like 12 n=1 Tax=Homarus americanus TaxID=6706 RepID=A0A8J5JV46_HOMAM|nr:Transposable element Tc1 transposase-like 12 [Homarus americanus]